MRTRVPPSPAGSSSGPAGECPPLVLNPSARLLWRDDHTIQLELGRRAVLVDNVDQPFVRRLTGNGNGPAAGSGVAAQAALGRAGLLMEPDMRPPHRPRLASELAALRIRHGEHADDLLAARAERTVRIQGDSPLVAVIGGVLAGAGVGRLGVDAPGDVRVRHVLAGGLALVDEGRRFTVAVHEAFARAAPDCDTSTPGPMDAADLVVLTGPHPLDSDVRDDLHRTRTAHLAVQLDGDHGVVGPLVQPGLTSCLSCADLHRLDRDPAWAALAVQLAVPGRHARPADTALSGLIANLTALQALAFLDGWLDDPEVAVIEGTLEMHLPHWALRRRSYPTHPDCGCGAHGDGRRQEEGPASAPTAGVWAQ
jgi:bacteriocin biosynthesis cyclodehydratase domain-containing protein